MRLLPRRLIAVSSLAALSLVATAVPRAHQAPPAPRQAEPHAPFPALPSSDALEIQ